MGLQSVECGQQDYHYQQQHGYSKKELSDVG